MLTLQATSPQEMHNQVKIMTALMACFFSAACNGSKQSPVSEYLAVRNAYITKLETSGDAVDERSALADLHDRLMQVIGPIQIVGSNHESKINLSTLIKEMGFGQLDGLRFESDKESIVVTTKELLSQFLLEHATLPKGMVELAKTEEFYLRSLTEDAAVYYYGGIPVKSSNNRAFVYAFMGFVAQDIGPFPPDRLFVFISQGNYIFVAMAKFDASASMIQSCQDEWNGYEKKSEEAFKAFRASSLRDDSLAKEAHQLEDEGFNAFVACYSRESKTEGFFVKITEQAQSLVERLQRTAIANQ